MKWFNLSSFYGSFSGHQLLMVALCTMGIKELLCDERKELYVFFSWKLIKSENRIKFLFVNTDYVEHFHIIPTVQWRSRPPLITAYKRSLKFNIFQQSSLLFLPPFQAWYDARRFRAYRSCRRRPSSGNLLVPRCCWRADRMSPIARWFPICGGVTIATWRYRQKRKFSEKLTILWAKSFLI